MKTFVAGTGRIQTLAFVGDGRQLLVDERDPLQPRGLSSYPARKLVWWDWQTGPVARELRLRDTLYDPAKTPDEWQEQLLGESDTSPDQPARDVFFDCAATFGAAIWPWTNKEDGISFFDPASGKQLEVSVSGDYPYRFAFDPQKPVYALASRCDGDGTHGIGVCRYTVETNARTWMRGVALGDDPADALAVADRYLAAASGALIRLWDWTAKPPDPPDPDAEFEEWGEWESGRQQTPPQRELTAFTAVNALAMSAKPLEVFAGTDSSLEVWRSNGSPRYVSLACEVAPVRALLLAPNGRLLVGGDGGLEWWYARTGERIARFEWGIGPVTAVALDATETLAAGGDARGNVVVWDVDG